MPKPPSTRPAEGRLLRGAALAAALSLTLSLNAFAAAPAGRPLQLEVFINEASTQLVAGFTQLPDGRLASTRKELQEAGIKPPGRGADEELIVLSDLKGLSYRYDEPRQRIDLVVANELRMPHLVDARGPVAALEPARAGYGAVLNYTLYAASVKEVDQSIFAFSGASVQLDGRAFTPFGYLQQTGILGTTTAREVEALRLETAFAYSHAGTATTYRAGDAISRGPLWAGPNTLRRTAGRAQLRAPA